MKTELQTRDGRTVEVNYGHPLWCEMENRRVRFSRMVDSTAVEVLDNDGKLLPDWRHVSQVFAY